jgi:outer membrane protein assembly factor BamD (BamD/ComL family)
VIVAAKAKRVEPPRLSGEVALVQQATRAFSGGETGVALAVLDAYRLQYPHGSLTEEAEVLRAQALAKAGDTTQAQALARRLLAADPNGVLAPRLRDLIPEDVRDAR